MSRILQTSKKFRVPEPIIDKIHGHTKIELTDVITGKKEIVEHDNDFQSGVLASFMRSLGYYNNNPYTNSNWRNNPAWRNLVGGILLFRDAIDNSNDEVPYMPAGNKMIANGSYGVTNSGNPVELGSYNSIESVIGTDSLTFVYDWDTSHGNGTIGAISLTSDVGGYIGYGNPSGAVASAKKFSENQSCNSYNVGNNSIVPQMYKDYVIKSVSIDTTESEVTINYIHVPYSKMSLFVMQNMELTISYTGTLPSTPDLSNIGYTKVAIDGDYLYVFPAYGENGRTEVSNGSSYTYIKVDLINKTASTGSFTNNTGHSVWVGFTHQFVADGIIYCPRYYLGSEVVNSDIDLIKLSDSSYVDTVISAGRWHYLEMVGAVADGFTGLGRADERLWLYDTVNKTQYPTNATTNIYDLRSLCINTNPTQAKDGLISGFSTYYASDIYICKNPLFLSTINNLSSAVTKTNTQTMKVTYTLTEASS